VDYSLFLELYFYLCQNS